MSAIFVLGFAALTFAAVLYAAHVKKEGDSEDSER